MALRAVPETAAARLRVRMHPSVTYLRSSWPVDRIWDAHQEGGCPDQVRLAMEDVRLEVRRTLADEVVFRRLAPADFVFRRMIAGGRCLGKAVSEAVDAEPAFDLPSALATVLGDTIVVAFGIEGTKETKHDEV